MKKLLLILLCLPMIGFGQDKEITELNNELIIVKAALNEHHKQFTTGVVVSIVGSAATIAGNLIVAPWLVIGGGITTLIGTIIMIDSDKWFGNRYTSPVKNEHFADFDFKSLTQFTYDGEEFVVGEEVLYDKTKKAKIRDILLSTNGNILVKIKLINGAKLRVPIIDIQKQ